MDVSEIAEWKARARINEVLADPRRQNTQIQKYPQYTLSASGLSSNLQKLFSQNNFALIRSPDALISVRNPG
jgi:hypothetical protein